jgi:tetratricopeptide (TPR) repeat protein
LLLNRAKGAAAGGFHEKAVELYSELSERHPDSAELLGRLVSSLQRMEDPAGISRIEVAALLARALAIDVDNSKILVQLSSLSGRSGNPEDAVRALRLALELEPCAGPPRSTLVALLHDVERPYEGLAAARQGVLQCPQLASALNDLAWILATSRLEDLRDGAQAIDLAQRALAAQPGDPGYRDTLAAAYAETGDFDRAAAIISEIIPDLERTHAPTRAIEEFRKHHDEFEARRPLRE